MYMYSTSTCIIEGGHMYTYTMCTCTCIRKITHVCSIIDNKYQSMVHVVCTCTCTCINQELFSFLQAIPETIEKSSQTNWYCECMH